MKTVTIKGKEYVMVHERIKYFRENYSDHSLISEIVEMKDGAVTFKASIIDPNGKILATGHAQEKEDNGFINEFSYIENCETSSWGRALANLGIGIDASVASADEVATAITNQNKPKRTGTKYKEFPHADKETIKKENIEEMLFQCNNTMEMFELHSLLTKEQQEDKDIKEWFSMRKEQLK